MKGSYCSDLTGKSLVFWISGNLREAVALLVHVYCSFRILADHANWFIQKIASENSVGLCGDKIIIFIKEHYIK